MTRVVRMPHGRDRMDSRIMLRTSKSLRMSINKVSANAEFIEKHVGKHGVKSSQAVAQNQSP